MRSSPQLYPDLEKEHVPGWIVALSLGMHVILFVFLMVVPGFGSRKHMSSPVYTVDLLSVAEMQKASGGSGKIAVVSRQRGIPTISPRRKARKIRIASRKPAVKRSRKIPLIKAKRAGKRKVRFEKAEIEKAIQNIVKKKQAQRSKVRPKTEQIARAQERKAEAGGTAKEAKNVSSGGGGKGAFEGIRLQIYRTHIWNKVRNNWSYPGMVAVGRNPEALVRLHVQKNGEIVDYKLVKSSGNPLFDQSVLRAVKLSDPLPPFPEGYLKSYEEIELLFTLSDLRKG